MTGIEAMQVLKRVKELDRSIDEQAVVASALAAACQEWRGSLLGLGMKGQLGAPDWATYEMKIWGVGEDLRHFLKKKKDWSGSGVLLDEVARLSLERTYGKGRQTLVLLLGEFGLGHYGDALGRLVDDPDVAGHAVKSLIKARIRGHGGAVAKLAQQGSGWVRQAAKKYMKEVDG